MTTERIDIQVDDTQLTELIGTLRDLVRGLNRVEEEADDAADTMNRLEREVKDVGSASQSGGRDLQAFVSGLGGAVAAFGGFEAAKAVFSATFDVLKEGYEAFIKDNEEAAARADAFTGALDNTLLSFGELIAQSPSFISVQETLIHLFSEAGNTSSRLGNTIQSLIDGALWVLEGAVSAVVGGIGLWVRATDFASGVIEIIAVHIQNQISLLNLLRLGVLRVALVVSDFLVGAFNSVISTFQDMVRTIAPFADTLGLDLTGVIRILDSVGESGDELVQSIRNALEDNGRAIGDTVDAIAERTHTGLENASRAWTDAITDYDIASSSIVGYMEEIKESTDEATRALQDNNRETQARRTLSDEDKLKIKTAQEERERQRREAAEQREKERLRREAQNRYERELAQRRRDFERAQDELERLRRERQQTILDAKTSIVESGFDFGSIAIDEMFAGADGLGIRIGQAFSDVAFNTLSDVAPDLLGITGPWGAAISGGIGLIGGVITGLFGRERKRREREARAARTQNFNTSTNIILTNQFGGIIGDRRAVAATVSDATRDAIRRGA